MIDKKPRCLTFSQLLLMVSDNFQRHEMQILKPYVCNQCNINYHLMFPYVVRDNFLRPHGVMEERYVCNHL